MTEIHDVALLDTTVHIDRKKMPWREKIIDTALKAYSFTITTEISLLEFKAVLIQECITIHNRLRVPGTLFTKARDELLESTHRQHRLRVHIFNNLLQVFPPSFDDSSLAVESDDASLTVESDTRLAEKARLQLENVIPLLYRWFVDSAADAILRSEIKCTRANEAPTKKTAAYSANLPKCRYGQNRFCHIEEFIRKRIPKDKIDELEASIVDSGDSDTDYQQLARAIEVLRSVHADNNRRLTVSNCRSIGDVLIEFEGCIGATHAVSTNKRDWEVISPIADMNFHHIQYPK